MDNLYTKYGSGSSGGITGLQASQTATANSFKEVLESVGGLQKTVEKQYIDENTSKLQDYLKQNIRSAGLGADAPEMDDITRQFGKLIDTDTLGKTITSTREKMMGEADSRAMGTFGKTFAETQDLGKGVAGYQADLESQGVKPALAFDKASKLYQASKHLPEQVANTENLDVLDFKGKLLEDARANPDISELELINRNKKGYSPRLQERLDTEGNSLFEKRSQLSTIEKDDQVFFAKKGAQELATFDQQHTQENAKHQAVVDRYDRYISPDAKAAAAKLASSPGGWADIINNNAESFFGGMFGKLDGKGITQQLQPMINDMVDGGMKQEDAITVAIQGWQEAKNQEGSAIWRPDGVTPEILRERVHSVYSNMMAKNAAMAAQNTANENALKYRTKLSSDIDDVLNKSLRGERRAGITGKDFDSRKLIAESRLGKPPIPVNPEPNTTATPDKASNQAPTVDHFNAALERAKKNAAKPGTTSESAAVVGNPAPIVANAPLSSQEERRRVSTENANEGWLWQKLKKLSDKKDSGVANKLSGPTSAEAAVSDDILKNKTDAARGIVAGYDIGVPGAKGSYAEDPRHISGLIKNYKAAPVVKTSADADTFIRQFKNSPITGQMVVSAATDTGVDPRMLLAVLAQDSSMGTNGPTSLKNMNPGNIGGDGKLNNRYRSWREGTYAAAKELKRRELKRNK